MGVDYIKHFGVPELMKEMERSGRDIEALCVEMVRQCAEIIEDDTRAQILISDHYATGEMYKAVKADKNPKTRLNRKYSDIYPRGYREDNGERHAMIAGVCHYGMMYPHTEKETGKRKRPKEWANRKNNTPSFWMDKVIERSTPKTSAKCWEMWREFLGGK